MSTPAKSASETSSQEQNLDLPVDPRASLRLLAQAAEDWGGTWRAEGDRKGLLGLPVMAGVRRGWVEGEVRVESAGEGSRLSFRVVDSEYRVERVSVVTLSMAAVGALVTLFAPLFPRLIALMPAGILLAVGAWLFIVARLRNSGPDEFFEELAAQAQRG